MASISQRHIQGLSSLLGFKACIAPFDYLGTPIFKGKPKKLHLRAIIDEVKQKLTAWKWKLLSLMGRLQLVRSVIE